MLIPASFYVEPGQENRIRRAIKKRKGCRVRVTKHQQPGPHHLLVTTNMLKSYGKAAKGKTVNFQFKPEHLAENMKHQGGFLPLIAAALAPLIGGILGGVIEKGISKGSGLYLNPAPPPNRDGSGLYLNPYPKY